MKKYILAALPLLIGNEILSLVSLTVIAYMAVVDLMMAGGERGC